MVNTLKRILFALIIATQILLAASVSQAQPYQPISIENSIVGDDLSRTETTIQSGNITLVAFFARRNFAVVGYSPRQHGLTAGSCESGAINCAPIRSLRDLSCAWLARQRLRTTSEALMVQ